mmetsp:Transcript_6291/g.14522  ORF Transcript_6291/g.14522 Transcript_6291/m.14522 type:complete len:83 (+) Transcript_6291:164-412(+)
MVGTNASQMEMMVYSFAPDVPIHLFRRMLVGVIGMHRSENGVTIPSWERVRGVLDEGDECWEHQMGAGPHLPVNVRVGTLFQ